MRVRYSRTVLLTVLFFASAGCSKPEPASSVPAPHASEAEATTASPPAVAGAAQPAVITSVHTQWIIADSQPKVEITLFGQNLAMNARVVSDSSQMQVDRIDPDPGRTLVDVTVDADASAGEYGFEYEVPGQAPIPFSIRLTGSRAGTE